MNMISGESQPHSSLFIKYKRHFTAGFLSAMYYLGTFFFQQIRFHNEFWNWFIILPSFPGMMVSSLFSCNCKSLLLPIQQTIAIILNLLWWFFIGFVIAQIVKKNWLAVVIWMIITIGIISLLSMFLQLIGQLGWIKIQVRVSYSNRPPAGTASCWVSRSVCSRLINR